MPQPDMASIVNALAAKQLGPDPSAPAAPQKDTAEGQATAKGAPSTEADKMEAPAVIYEVEFGQGDTRKLTPQQIASTFQRYSAMNFKNASMKPVMDVIEQIMGDNPGIKSDELATKMAAIYKAQQSNPQMGNVNNKPQMEPGRDQAPQGGLDEMLSKWEEDNAASLPPGYKDILANSHGEISSIKQQLAQTQEMLRQVLSQSQGVADAARTGVQSARNDSINAVRQAIANNVDRAQQALQLPDQAAQDFMTFASERGYTIEDFVDPQLTLRVMSDFRNAMNSPEMERLRSIASRRQAYTGSIGQTPASPEAGAAPAGAGRFNSMVDSALSKR